MHSPYMEQSAWNGWVILSACQRKQLGLICWCKVTAKQNTFLTLQPLEVAFPLQASNMPKSKFSACEQSISFHKLFFIYSVNSLWSETASESSPSPTRGPMYTSPRLKCVFVYLRTYLCVWAWGKGSQHSQSATQSLVPFPFVWLPPLQAKREQRALIKTHVSF